MPAGATCKRCGRRATGESANGVFCGNACGRADWAALGHAERLAALAAWPRVGAEPPPPPPPPTIVRIDHVNLNVVALTREEMGRVGWTFFHAIAGALDDGPLDAAVQSHLRAYVTALTVLYPCEECRAHFETLVRAAPPDVSSGAAFRAWLCGAHNRVNVRLGKPCVDCETAPRVGCERA